MNELLRLSALELGRKIQTGEVSAAEAARASLDKINGSELGAYITVSEDWAMTQAAAVQAKISEGALQSPLAGVPAAIKDNICTLDVKTTCASKILGDFHPPYNATAVDRMAQAGAVVLGKTNMDEFAMGSTSETSYYGPTRNPWNRGHVPGGSSGGSAAAVANGEAFYALGSDTGGSVRNPASFCGVTGMKPTYGTVSRYGLIAYASSLDQIGVLARTAEDCAGVLDTITGHDVRDSTSLNIPADGLLAGLTGDVRGLKIGLPAECFGDGLEKEVGDHVLAAAAVLKSLGAETETFSLPLTAYAVPAYYLIACAEASSNLSRFDGVKYGFRAEGCTDMADLHKKTRSQGFGREVQKRIMLGTFALSTGYYDAYYKKAQQARAAISGAYHAAFEKYDLIVCPVFPDTAPALGEALTDPLKTYLSDIYTVSVNLAGLPGISVPCGFDEKGLPIGTQIIGKALDDGRVLNAAHAYQQATDYHKAMPTEGGAQA